MNEIELFKEKLIDFIYQTDLEEIPEYYYDAFLNFLGVNKLGANHPAISIVLKTLLEEQAGRYKPFHREEKISLSDVALIDCFSSAILAYDDIHFETTTHPCGPVISAILALARMKPISLHETLNALYIGMEVECAIATAIFFNTDCHNGWYTTGIAGGIGATAALCHLLKFNKDEIKSAVGLSCNYASGVRGSHGSMTGSFIPAIASKNGFLSAMLVKNGMTCSFTSLIGKNGLINQLTTNPNIKKARAGLGKYASLNSSCKPYPFGFISFSAISLLIQLDITDFKEMIVEVSSRVKTLGSNNNPQTMYDGFVSLPYIIALIIKDKKNAYIPLNNNFIVTQEIKEIMNKIIIKENKEMSDEEIFIYIDNKKYYLKNAPGSINNPMKHNEVIAKFKKITNTDTKFIEDIYHKDIQDIYQFIIDNFK